MSSATHRRFRLRRTSVAAALAGLVAGLVTVVSPAPAHADIKWPPCWEFGTFRIHDPESLRWLFVFTVRSATPTFLKSEGRFATNHTDREQTVQFTSSVTDTKTMATAVNFSAGTRRQIVQNVFEISASFGITRTVTESTATSIGVNVTITAPPRSTVQGDYGVRGYILDHDYAVYDRRTCELQGHIPNATMTIPTTDQGWETRIIPL